MELSKTISRLAVPAGVLIAAAVFSGCDSNNGSSSPPQGVGAEMEAIGQICSDQVVKDCTEVSATFYNLASDGTKTPIILDFNAGDSLVAVSGVDQDMTFSHIEEGFYYYTTQINLDGINDSDQQFQVILGIESTGLDAQDSFIILPDSTPFTAPAENTAYESTADVNFTWAEVDATKDIQLSSSSTCGTWNTDTSDDGTFTITASELAGGSQSEGTTCDVTVSMLRVIEGNGSLDPQLTGGGSVTGEQIRTVDIVVNF